MIPWWWAPELPPVHGLQVWSRGELVEPNAEFTSWSVPEKRVSGIRSTLSAVVEPSPEWLDWLTLPALELVPLSGFRWGSEEHLEPLGVFPILGGTLSDPLEALTLSASDNWQTVIAADFLVPQMAYPGLIRDVAANLIFEAGVGGNRVHPETLDLVRWPLVTATSEAVTPMVAWTKSRHDTIMELVQSISAECFLDRLGRPVIRDRVAAGSAVLSGVAKVVQNVDWSDVVNFVSVVSTNDDVDFGPVVATIDSPFHPASVDKLGYRALRHSSSLITTVEQAQAAANDILAKRSAPATTWTVTCLPDPSIQPGMQVTVPTVEFGDVVGVVDEVTHSTDDVQTIKLVAA